MREEGKDEERKTAGEGRERGTRKARKSRKLFYVSGKQKIILGKASSLEPEAIGRPSRFLKPGKVFPFLLNYGKYNCVPVIIPLPSPIFSLSLPPSLSLLFAFLIFFLFLFSIFIRFLSLTIIFFSFTLSSAQFFFVRSLHSKAFFFPFFLLFPGVN